jgi:two-component system, LytTR family, response regulator
MHVLIVDDEPLARTALMQILRARPDVEQFESANDAIEAEEYLARNHFDIMLLDVSMPEVSGLQLLSRLERHRRPIPSIVFVTAHAEYALAAFECHATDYIVKPFSEDRVNQALDFALRRSASERAARLLEVLPHLKTLTHQQSSKIGIKANDRILFIDPRDVLAVEAEGNYVLLRREKGSDLLRESISAVGEKLKPFGFIRIHRSVLVNTSFVADIRPCRTGEYQLRLRDGREYTVTRTYKQNLSCLAAFWIGTGTALS